jgi:hypothetical protein
LNFFAHGRRRPACMTRQTPVDRNRGTASPRDHPAEPRR